MKKIIFASAFATALAVGLPVAAQSGMGGFEIGDPYGCWGCTRPWGYYRGPMSCGEARAHVRRSGYKNINTIECRGSTYIFEATRKGHDFTLFVNSRTGALSRR